MLHGLVQIPENLVETFFVGGDARYISRKTKNSAAEVDEGFLMQAQLRVGLAFKKLKFLMSIGKIENPRNSSEVKLQSTEHYVLYSPKKEIHFRAGRFEPVYGLRMPDHNLWIKSEIGLVPWLEKDSVEMIFEGETQFLSFSGFQSTSAVQTAQQATGYTASIYQVFNDTSRVGLSIMNSEGQGSRFRSTSLHGTFSFSEKSYSLLELTRLSSAEVIKELGFLRLGFEVAKGFTPTLQAQTRFTLTGEKAKQHRLGYGFIWLPRPHFEIMGLLDQFDNSKEKSKEATLLVHYYL